MKKRHFYNFSFLHCFVSFFLFFCTSCLTTNLKHKSNGNGHKEHSAGIRRGAAKERRLQAKLHKKEPSKAEKEVRDDNNKELLFKVADRLHLGKNISTSVTGKDLRGEICFVKFDTLQTSLQQNKLQITISEMIKGQEIALSFALFASNSAERESSDVVHSNISSEKIIIEQDEVDNNGANQAKRLSVDLQDQDSRQFVIDKLSPENSEAPPSKSCTVALLTRS